MDVLFVPGGFRFSAHVDRMVERALDKTGHKVIKLCLPCLRTIGQGALKNVAADVLFTVHGRQFPHKLLREVNYPKAVWLLDEPQEVDMSEKYGRHFDIVFTNEPNTQGIHGVHKCWYLPLGMDESVHRPGKPSLPMVDVTFAGGVRPERAKLLDQVYHLSQDLSWRVVGPDRWEQPVSFGALWERRVVPYDYYLGAIRSSRIVVDIPCNDLLSFAGRTNQRGIHAVGVGIRPFEVAGCGRALLVTSDVRADIFNLFPDGAVVTYRDGDATDLVRVIRKYIEDEEMRLELVARGRKVCLERHTYRDRMHHAMNVVKCWMDTRLPPKPKRKKK